MPISVLSAGSRQWKEMELVFAEMSAAVVEVHNMTVNGSSN
jgi:hypothetical protein